MNIFTKNYEAVVNRGLINSQTTKKDFLNKLIEELDEFGEEFDNDNQLLNDREAEELTDIINTCNNWLIFSGRNPISELEKICIKNEKRCKKQ